MKKKLAISKTSKIQLLKAKLMNKVKTKTK